MLILRGRDCYTGVKRIGLRGGVQERTCFVISGGDGGVDGLRSGSTPGARAERGNDMNQGSGLAYRDQEAAEEAVAVWRHEYILVIDELKALNERLDSKSLDAQISRMESQLRRL